jgi:hypothetical protein
VAVGPEGAWAAEKADIKLFPLLVSETCPCQAFEEELQPNEGARRQHATPTRYKL